METRRSGLKRTRSAAGPSKHDDTPDAAAGAASSSGAQAKDNCMDELELSLQVKWTSGSTAPDDGPGKTRITRLQLKPLEDVDKLGGLSKGLMDRAYPADSRPSYLTDDTFYRWTPDETCLSYPLDVTSTEFKLVATYGGWEYVILTYELGDPVEPPERPLFITVIEFESVAVVLGNLGIRISLVAYPVVCVQKPFIDNVREQLKNNPEFKGILS